MAAIREIKPGEDPSTVFAEMSNSNVSSDDDYDESEDDLYEDDDDEDLDLDDGFDMFGTLTDGRGVCAKNLGKIRIPSFGPDDDDIDHTECSQCACDKHKKILSFMDACVKLGFQLLSSDFDKSFKPLQNAFNSSQKSTPIKQLNGVALSVKRVCNYALEQTCAGYIEKFKKFIQKEMVDTDFEHIEFLIELHFDMKENFDCYSKNYVLLLAIASQLKPAYNEAVAYRVNSKAFKESQAIDRFLKTQEDIRSALVHYEKVLLEIKEKFDERHDPKLEMPNTPDSTRTLMNGSFWTNVETDLQQGELESSSEHIDLRSFELELEKENLKNQGTSTSGGTGNVKSKKTSKTSGSNDALPNSNESSKPEKTKKSKKKPQPPEKRSESSPSVEPNLVPRGNVSTKEKLLKSVHCTSTHCERAFKVKHQNVSAKYPSNNSSRERSGSSTRKSGISTPLTRIPTVEKLKNSCLIRNFDCCDGKLEKVKESEDSNAENANSEQSVEIFDNMNENVETNSEGKESSSGFRPEDYLDESDEFGMEDMTEFITVNSKRNNNKIKTQNIKTQNTFDVFSTDLSSIKKFDPFQNDEFTTQAFNLDKAGKGRGSKFDNRFYGPIVGTNNSIITNGPIENAVSDAFSALSSTTNSLTVSQKMQALMSSEPKAVVIPPEPASLVSEPKKLQDDEQSKSESNKVDEKSDSKSSSDFGMGSNVEVPFGNGPFMASKIKPISKPVATVDPCKVDNSVVTTSAKSVDNWNPIGTRFSAVASAEIGSDKLSLETPLFQGYSPFNGTDRLQAVQDSMAQYTKSTGSTPRPNDFENSSKEPIQAGDLGFSAFQNGNVYSSGIFSNPTSKENSSLNGRFGIRPPGFDFGSDLLKYGSAGNAANFNSGKNELSPDLDLKSNLNPTASVFNPTVANAGTKEFFPSANPPGPLFQRSNSTPDTPFLTKTGASNFPSALPPVNSIPSRAKEESTSKFFPSKASNLPKAEFLKLYKQQMHFHLRLVNSEIDGTKSKAVLLEKLKTHTTHIDDLEISSLLVELQGRIKVLRELTDNIYCLYKHNIRLITSFDVVNEQLFPIMDSSEAVTALSPKLERLFSTISFS